MEHEFIEWDWAQIWSMNLLNGIGPRYGA